mgnify:CR=1 FL=1
MVRCTGSVSPMPSAGERTAVESAPALELGGHLDATESMVASQTASVQASKDKAGNGTVEATTALLGSEEGAVTLDITRPDTDETGLPIFFYIHGGNNQTGKSAAFPATQFAQEVNCVVVSVNHVWAAGVQRASRHPDRYGGRKFGEFWTAGSGRRSGLGPAAKAPGAACGWPCHFLWTRSPV